MVEHNTDRLWFSVGAIIVGAILIFMFRSNIGVIGDNIFGQFNDSIEAVAVDDMGPILTVKDGDEGLVKGEDNIVYVKAREGLWYKLNKLDNNGSAGPYQGLATAKSEFASDKYIYGIDGVADSLDAVKAISGIGVGPNVITGSFVVPSTVNGIPVTSVHYGLSMMNAPANLQFSGSFYSANLTGYASFFSNSKFTGTFKTGKLYDLSDAAFTHSDFDGDFIVSSSKFEGMPNGAMSFPNSTFKGKLDLSKIKTYTKGSFVLLKAQFTGDLILPDGLTSVHLPESKFNGKFEAKSTWTFTGSATDLKSSSFTSITFHTRNLGNTIEDLFPGKTKDDYIFVD